MLGVDLKAVVRGLSAAGTGLAVIGAVLTWAPSEATRHRILVENPEALYGFTKSR